MYKNTGNFSPDEFRSFRLLHLRRLEELLSRRLEPFEKEIILFPRLCINQKCKEFDFHKLNICNNCYQVAYCKNKPNHFDKQHSFWCKYYLRFHKIIEFQENFGKIEPCLPTKIMKEATVFNDIKSVLNKLSCGTLNKCKA